MIRSFAIALAVCLIASQAEARWEYTRWGMSPGAVAAASRGAVHVGPGAKTDQIGAMPVGAVGAYRSGGRSFHAVFYFKKGRLALIKLTLLGNPDQCSAVLADLTARYGGAENDDPDSDTILREWRDAPSDNQITFMEIDKAMCDTNFSPLPVHGS